MSHYLRPSTVLNPIRHALTLLDSGQSSIDSSEKWPINHRPFWTVANQLVLNSVCNQSPVPCYVEHGHPTAIGLLCTLIERTHINTHGETIEGDVMGVNQV